MTRFPYRLPTIFLVALVAAAAAHATPPDFVRVAPADVHWVADPDSPGVQTATLYGDPDKPGMYAVRVRVPPHVMDRPHWHPNARYVTVLQGTWYAGTGDVFDVKRAVAMPAGSFMLHPAGAHHWDGSAGDEPVIVQIIGYGPQTGTAVDPKAPLWVELAH